MTSTTKICSICNKAFDPAEPSDDPAVAAGRFLAQDAWKDDGELCNQCLANRGILGMMYCREYTG